MGLLYGKRDLDKTIVIASRCGQDCDCNPSNAAGVLFTTMGMEKLPERFTGALDRDAVFSHTEYSFTKLVKVCEKLTRQALERAGGRIENETLVIPVRRVKPSQLEQCWEPGPAAKSKFTAEEKARITAEGK